MNFNKTKAVPRSWISFLKKIYIFYNEKKFPQFILY